MITKRRIGDVLVLAPEGRIAAGAGDVELRAAIGDALAAGERKLVIDLARVSMLDSSGVGELVGGHTSLRKRGGALKLCRLDPRVYELLATTRLTGVLEVFDDESSALRSFG